MTRTVAGAVLLAAGRGARLKPYTNTTPKPLLPINGKPTLDLYFESLASAGVADAVLVTHHLGELVERYALQVPELYDIKCTTVPQPSLNGTASALECVINYGNTETDVTSNFRDGACENATRETVNRVLGSSFLLMATDYLIPANFIDDLLSFHSSHKADVSISLKRVPQAELASRSSVRFGDDGQILEIVEKPKAGMAPSDLAANLAFVLPAKVCSYIEAVEVSARGEREVQSAINHYLAHGGSARGLIQDTPDEWSPERNL